MTKDYLYNTKEPCSPHNESFCQKRSHLSLSVTSNLSRRGKNQYAIGSKKEKEKNSPKKMKIYKEVSFLS